MAPMRRTLTALVCVACVLTLWLLLSPAVALATEQTWVDVDMPTFESYHSEAFKHPDYEGVADGICVELAYTMHNSDDAYERYAHSGEEVVTLQAGVPVTLSFEDVDFPLLGPSSDVGLETLDPGSDQQGSGESDGQHRYYSGTVTLTYRTDEFPGRGALDYACDLRLIGGSYYGSEWGDSWERLDYSSFASPMSFDGTPLLRLILGENGYSFMLFRLVGLGFGDPEEGVVQTVTTKAEQTPGEDKGTDIAPEVVEKPVAEQPETTEDSGPRIGTTAAVGLGVTGVLAVAIAVRSAGRGKKGGEDADPKEKPKRYRMYVYKDFGDAIQKGGRPVQVRTRIVEVGEDGERDRGDLTAKIAVSAQVLEARATGMEGRWQCAAVTAPKDAGAGEGTLTFTFRGAGGTFRQDVVFRLVDEPRIVFPGEAAGGNWDLNVVQDTVQMVAGEGGTDRLRFVFVDAVEEPKSIRFVNADDFDIEPQKDARLAYTYYACIRNLTDRASKEAGVFAEVQERRITIEAEFEGHVVVRAEFVIELYPDGLSVLITGGPNPLRPKTPGMRTVLKGGRMEVISYATKGKEELSLDPPIPPTDFDPCFAAVRPDGTALIAREPYVFAFDELEGTDEPTRNILAKYRYEVRWHQNGYAFRPRASLPEMEGGYYVLLPMSGSAEGLSQSVEVPVRLLGEPFDPMKGWDAEFRGLCNTAIRYYPAEVAHGYVQYFKQNFAYPELWDKSELRMMRYSVIRASQEFWTRQYNNQMRLIEHYDLTELIFKRPPRFIADLAFSIVAQYYWGDNEAWITPCKDLIVDTVDEVLWDIAFSGREMPGIADVASVETLNAARAMDLDIVGKLMEQATNTLENHIGLQGFSSAREQKKLFFVLTAYLLADWVKNYYGMSPRDFWESWRKTWFDMTAMALKQLVGAGLQQAMRSKVVNDFFNSKLMNKVNEYLPGIAKGKFSKPGAAGTRAFERSGNVDLSVVRSGNVWKATYRPSGKTMLVQLEDMSYVGYREAVQKLLDSFFGMGVVWLAENANETVRDEAGYRGIVIPEIVFPLNPAVLGLDDDYEELLVRLDVVKFFSSETGLSSEGFNFLFETLFGPVSLLVRHIRTSGDAAKEILRLAGMTGGV